MKHFVAGRASDRKGKFRVRSVDSPAGPREAMCYVYDEAYKNWVPWGPNSLLQIHDWSAIWDRPHWYNPIELYTNLKLESALCGILSCPVTYHCGCRMSIAKDVRRVPLMTDSAWSVCRPQYEEVYKHQTP